jgi:hypothetical protein
MTAFAHSPLFPLGEIVITRNALQTLVHEDILESLGRHARCDCGERSPDDPADYEFAQKACASGGLLSIYRDRKGKKFWIFTERDRTATTVLLPEEY